MQDDEKSNDGFPENEEDLNNYIKKKQDDRKKSLFRPSLKRVTPDRHADGNGS